MKKICATFLAFLLLFSVNFSAFVGTSQLCEAATCFDDATGKNCGTAFQAEEVYREPMNAAAIYSNADAFLLSIGTPKNVVDSLDNELKQTIWDTSLANGTTKAYAGMETKSFSISPSGETEMIPNYISPADMTMQVVAFQESDYNGYTQYSIYSSFERKKEVHIKDDALAFSLPEGWEVTPGKKNLRIHVYDDLLHQWTVAMDISAPCEAEFTGYGFNGFGDECVVSALYKGTAYTYAYKKNPSVTNMIKVGYAHENSMGGIHFPGGISIAIGPLSISFSSSGGANITTSEDIFSF